MEFLIVFELLKFFLEIFETYQNVRENQKEKALALTVEKLSQRLSELEKSLAEKSD